MPPRQGHRKSRTGCQRCKQRKVKCDEKRPTCTGCLRYPHACVYPVRNGPSWDNHSIASEIASESANALIDTLASSPSDPGTGLLTPYSDIPIAEIEPDRRRALELLLLHHFETSTVKTFPGWRFPRVARRWLSDCVHVALEHDCLLHTMFAVTALHLVLVPMSRPGPNHKFEFERVHRIYLNLATREQREAISNLNEKNAEAVCWTSIMMSYISLNLLPEDNDPEVYVVPYRWLSMALAIGTMYQATMRWTQGWTTLDYMVSSAGPDFRDDSQMYDYDYEGPFRKLLTFDDGVEIVNDVTLKVYDKALAYIAKNYKSFTVDHENYARFCRRLFALGPMAGEGFVAFVGQERPRALAILAYHCAMLKAVDDAWFFRGVAERELNGVSKLLPHKWKWAMDWPLSSFGTIVSMECAWSEDSAEDPEKPFVQAGGIGSGHPRETTT